MFKLTRTLTPEAGRVFFAMPYGSKRLTEDGEPFDFDNLYQKVFVRAATIVTADVVLEALGRRG